MDRFGDEWCREADWFRVQEGVDLAQLAPDGVGVHYTDAWDTIQREGVGAPRDYLFEHEVAYIYCLLPGDLMDAVDAAGQTDVAVERAYREAFPKPRVFWFATDRAYEGGTASPADGVGLRTLVDLEALGDWLGENVEAYAFTDDAGGWGVYWSGAAAPASVLTLDSDWSPTSRWWE